MEGLIPMVYKSLKKNSTRRKYECLSSGAAAQTYNVADFYINSHDVIKKPTEEPDNVPPARGPHHRRYNSVHVPHDVGFGLEEDICADRPKQQLVRFRSHRMFSCVTGGA